MPRYRVEVNSVSVYYVDAVTSASACCKGIANNSAGVRPAYRVESVADAFEESPLDSTAAVRRERQRRAAAEREAEHAS